jgi:hypothetical protein
MGMHALYGHDGSLTGSPEPAAPQGLLSCELRSTPAASVFKQQSSFESCMAFKSSRVEKQFFLFFRNEKFWKHSLNVAIKRAAFRKSPKNFRFRENVCDNLPTFIIFI